MNTVSSASITGMVVSLILCVAAPVALCILLKRKTGVKLSDMLLGAVTFVIFAMFLEQMLHLAMSAVFGEKLTGNLWLSALYGGAAAAVFEEFGRLIAMKYFLGSQLEKENALMYGVGHGGVEALFVGGLTCVSNLATVSMVNGGKLESAYLVYRAARYHRRGFFLAAMGIHFAVDALAALLKDAVPIPALEAILAVIVIVTAIFTVRLYRGETEKAVSD